jgi:regulator of cell morphogenesis and NO signaling
MITSNASPAELSVISSFSANVLRRFNVDVNATKPLNSFQIADSIDPDFIIDLICAPFQNEMTNIRSLKRYDVGMVVKYLQRSHNEYLYKRIPEIERTLEILTEGFSNNSAFAIAINSLFSSYREHLIEHINYEEERLFPYALSLHGTYTLSAEQSMMLYNYSSMQFLAEHNHSPIDISVIIKLFKAYRPDEMNASPYRLLIQQINAFKEDMNIHELLEDHVLVPKLIELEMA